MFWPCPRKIGNKITKNTKLHEGKKLSDGLGTLGKGRLTDKITNKMQNYYDMAIRQNTLSQNNDEEKALHSIKKLVWHCKDMPENQERHAVCPREANSWCKY